MPLVKLGGDLLASAIAERGLQGAARLLALTTSETLSRNGGVSFGRHHDFDNLVQAAPPTLMVSFTLPSSSRCSVTLCPRRRDSILLFSMAYV